MLRLALLLLVAGLCACQHTPQRFHLYYGSNVQIVNNMPSVAHGGVIVVDSRALSPSQQQQLLAKAREERAIVLGYLSIGELEQSQRARAEQAVGTLEAALLNWNDKFASWRVDVSHPAWQRWLTLELQRLTEAGFSGFFLDTPDTVDHYITHASWTRTQRGEKVRAMVTLIRSIKQRYPQQFVLLNRGLNLVSDQIWMDEHGRDTEPGLGLFIAHNNNPDAILYENAFASRDEWTQRIEHDLVLTAQTKRTQVFVLGYADTFGDRDAFFERAKRNGFVAAWANSSTDLHQYPTISPK